MGVVEGARIVGSLSDRFGSSWAANVPHLFESFLPAYLGSWDGIGAGQLEIVKEIMDVKAPFLK